MYFLTQNNNRLEQLSGNDDADDFAVLPDDVDMEIAPVALLTALGDTQCIRSGDKNKASSWSTAQVYCRKTHHSEIPKVLCSLLEPLQSTS